MLVITIIVMIILAASIIISLNSSNIIGKAKEAKETSDIANAKHVVALAKAEWDLMSDAEKEKYEDSFVEYATEKLREAGYSEKLIARLSISENGAVEAYPDLENEIVLAASNTWYQGKTPKNTITTINIVDTADETLKTTATESWPAAVDRNGDGTNDNEIMCYVTGTTLTIAGNGSGKIIANPNSEKMFSAENDETELHFVNVTEINGANLLNTSNVTNMKGMFNHCNSLKTVDVSNWDTRNVKTMHTIFQDCASLETIDVSKWDTSKVTDMTGIFNMGSLENNSITKLEVSNWNTSNVTSMKRVFCKLGAVKELDLSKWNTDKVTDMYGMFYSCEALTTIGDTSRWDTGKVTDMHAMFYHCIELKELNVSNWNTSNVTDVALMFAGYNYGSKPMKLEKLDVSKWNTGKVTTMASLFYGCQKLGTIDVSNWDVSKVQNFDHMFAHSYVVLEGKESDNSDAVKKWDTSSVKNLNALFHTVQNKKIDISNFTTSNVVVFGQMFENCTQLTEIIGLENFNTANGEDFSEMFSNCTSLKELNLSSFDTTKANDISDKLYRGGEKCNTLKDMFKQMSKLQKITLGPKFSFNGDGVTTVNVGVLPTPTPTYISGADGFWYNEAGTPIAPADVPNKTAGTYWATKALVGT